MAADGRPATTLDTGLHDDARATSTRPEHSTEPEQPSPGWTGFERALRAAVFLVVFGVVIAALVGLAGLRTREVTATSERLEVSVTYAQSTRSGISTPFEIDVSAPGGGPLPERLEVRVSTAYLAMFDENGLDPEPVSSTSDGTEETWHFELEPGSTRLHVDLDARLQPNVHSGETGTVRVSELGAEPVEVEFRTWVLP